jgi:hypothetical protein
MDESLDKRRATPVGGSLELCTGEDEQESDAGITPSSGGGMQRGRSAPVTLMRQMGLKTGQHTKQVGVTSGGGNVSQRTIRAKVKVADTIQNAFKHLRC